MKKTLGDNLSCSRFKIKDGRWKEALLYGMLWFCPEYRKGKHLVWRKEYDKIVDWLESIKKPAITIEKKKLNFITHNLEKHIVKEVAVETIDRSFRGKGLLLLGSCGTGKSYITTIILPRLLNVFYSNILHNTFAVYSPSEQCYYMDDQEKPIPKIECLDLNPDYTITKARDINDLVDKEDGELCLPRGSFHVIDDLGEERERVFFGDRMLVMPNIMDEWSDFVAENGEFDTTKQYGIPILSTNLTVNDIDVKYGSRFVSRINRCFSHVVVMQGNDLSGHDKEPLDISILPFYDDWQRFKKSYSKQADCGNFVGYIWARMQVPKKSVDTDKDAAQIIDMTMERKRAKAEAEAKAKAEA